MNDIDLIMEKDGWFGVDDVLRIVRRDNIDPRIIKYSAKNMLIHMYENKMLYKKGNKYKVNNKPKIDRNSFEDKIIHIMYNKIFVIGDIKSIGVDRNNKGWRYKKIQKLVKKNILTRVDTSKSKHKYMVPKDVFSRFFYR